MGEQRYEYTVKNLNAGSLPELSENLNKYARKGWQLREIKKQHKDQMHVILERPVD